MKNLINLLCFTFLLSSFTTITAQETAYALDAVPNNYKKRSALYDYSEVKLNNTDTVADFDTKLNKLKITGTIYQSDGKTPASDVILFIHQPDENGNYDIKRDDNRKRYINHRAWIKTDEDGKYTFYTFMPGSVEHTQELKHIHRTIKEPGKPEYDMESFYFNDDPIIPSLSLACRAKMVKSMLRINKEGNMYVASKDIILSESLPDYE